MKSPSLILSWIRISFLLYAAVLLFEVVEPRVTRGDESELASIVRSAWELRQQNTRSLCFEWSEELDMSPNFATRLNVARSDNKKSVQIPAKVRVVLDGDRGRYSEERIKWSPRHGKTMPRELLKVANRNQLRELFPTTDFDYPVGNVVGEAKTTELLAMEGVVPVALCYRILHPDFKVFPATKDNMVVRSVETEQGRFAVATFKQGPSQVHLWLLPDRDHIPTRFQFVTPTGDTINEMQIKYQHDKDHGWVPMEWTSTHFGAGGTPSMTRRCKVTRFAINDDFAPEEFELEFPPGSWVTEQPNNLRYIIRRNGEKRLLREFESVADYDRIMRSDSLEPDTADGSRRVFLIVLNVCVIAGIGIALSVCAWFRKNNK